jgi:glycosyltransferase involved in cell wall biosynthesis
MKKISVIVPVFNAGEYLKDCIESIQKQKYKQWELLLVDNGSVDGSRELCEQYAARDERIVSLSEEKRGASAARNAGLARADGDYIVFADADDYLADDEVFERMAAVMEETNADIAVGNYLRLWNGRQLLAARHSCFSEKERESADFRFQGFFSVGTLSYVWGKMYRRSFLTKHQIQFGNYRYAEDKMFNFSCYIFGAVYAFTEQDVYVYRKNDASVSYSYREDSVECWMNIAEDFEKILEDCQLKERYGDLSANTVFFAVFFDAKMRYTYAGKKMRAVKQVLKEYRSYEMAKQSFRSFASGRKLKQISSVLWKVMIWGFSAAMYCKCYYLLALGIKILIDCRIDERLSDTGLRE